jgi:hypothetical protein
MVHRFSNPTEASLRATALALVAVFGMVAAPTAGQAAPVVLHDLAGVSSNIIEIRGGCGRGWHPVRWVDRYGRWRVRCVPNRSRRYY